MSSNMGPQPYFYGEGLHPGHIVAGRPSDEYNSNPVYNPAQAPAPNSDLWAGIPTLSTSIIPVATSNISPAVAVESSTVLSSSSAKPHGVSGRKLMTAIFVPIAVVALLLSVCVFCLLRRRRRGRRDGARELRNFSQESVQDLSAGAKLATHSRPVSEVAPGMRSEYYSAFSDAPPPKHGPLITVDGPSFSRAREASLPPSYKSSGSDSTASSPRSTHRPASSQFSETTLSMYRNSLRSPFADAEDDLVSEISASDARRAAPKDADAVSVLSDAPDYSMRPETMPHRGV